MRVDLERQSSLDASARDPTCRVSMWLVRVQLGEIADQQQFSCQVCDRKVIRTMAVEVPRAITSGLDHGTLQVGQRVSRKTTDERGTVVDVNNKIKVKWDDGRTSYFRRDREADVHPLEPKR